MPAMLNLNDLHFFVAAVEQGSFAAASRRLGVPKSTVSKRVAELEHALQARLVHRTSRSFTLTDAGQAFYEHRSEEHTSELQSREKLVCRLRREKRNSCRTSCLSSTWRWRSRRTT